MARLEKLIARICSRPPEADYEDVHRLLLSHGWWRRGCEGSHCVYVKDDEQILVIPKDSGRKVKRRYCDEVCKRLGIGE